MVIRCHGSRGSIPVSGGAYLKYGGDTTCLEIRTKNDAIVIVDAGSGIRRLGNKLLDERRYEYNLIFTHSHWDHMLGFPFFKPIYEGRTVINLLGCVSAQGDLRTLLSQTMIAPFFPVPFENLKAKINYSDTCGFSFHVDSIEVFPIGLSHPNQGLGYKFVEDGKAFVFLTDNELGYRHEGGATFDDYVDFSRKADLLIHDAEFTPEEYKKTRAWGHSTYKEALNLAIKAEVKQLGLFHHNQDRDDAAEDRIVQECREVIGKKKLDLGCIAISQTTTFQL